MDNKKDAIYFYNLYIILKIDPLWIIPDTIASQQRRMATCTLRQIQNVILTTLIFTDVKLSSHFLIMTS